MKKVKESIVQGHLLEARQRLETLLKDDPLSLDLRSMYVELLCVLGELEKADQQLDMMVRQHPDCLMGAVNLRQLIRAQTARQDFYQGGMTATLFAEADASFEALLSLHLALREGQIAAAEQAAQQLESLRQPAQFELNGETVQEIRDLDDSLAGYLELLGTDGKFYLAKFSEIESLELQPVKSIIDMAWRRVNISIVDGPQGEAFLPVCYIASSKELSRLGRETDWHEHGDHLVTGLGQKMLLVNDQAMPLTQLRQWHALTVVSH
ncbi:type VI secretion system accessory protein TagJ [Alkalimonas sp.]|uniref:type VI secretion system accessory protein TagJ n=1 Tax=Alkalimonas sp. TaxID=1872453 RepID=UPI00263B7B52|nr:type VI secretion system accessory protein TagJ [Alkalimonas sp.]MCC5825384.1 tetratricopeptide repeat protein [Alkalimonas sp.]